MAYAELVPKLISGKIRSLLRSIDFQTHEIQEHPLPTEFWRRGYDQGTAWIVGRHDEVVYRETVRECATKLVAGAQLALFLFEAQRH